MITVSIIMFTVSYQPQKGPHCAKHKNKLKCLCFDVTMRTTTTTEPFSLSPAILSLEKLRLCGK